MTQELPRGGNTPLAALLVDEGLQLRIRLEWASTGVAVDAGCFLLNDGGKCRGASDMIFRNNQRSADGTVVIEPASMLENARQQQEFKVDLGKLPTEISRISFYLSVDSPGVQISHVGPVSIAVKGGTTRQEHIISHHAVVNTAEVAFIMGELYRRNGEWKFRSVGQGFADGLSALAQSYGMLLTEAARAVSSVQVLTQPTAPINSVHSFKKPPTGFTEFVVNLTWNAGVVVEEEIVPSRGLLSGIIKPKAPRNIDLDLCCLFELNDGYRGVVQALGDSFGTFNMAPFMELMGDERQATGGQQGETLRINGARWDEIRRILVYAMIFEGTPNWAKASGKAFIRIPDMVPISVKLDLDVSDRRACTIAMITNDAGNIMVEKLVEPFKNPRELDSHYGWGLRWTAGMKD